MLDVEAHFRDYLREGYAVAPVRSYASAGIQLTAPWETMLKVRLCMAGFSEEEVLTGFLPARWYDYFSAIEWHSANTCDRPDLWRRVFFTKEEAQAMEVACG